MRAIRGEIDNPLSDNILVIRGIDDSSLEYLKIHKEKYPTWGCVVVPEYKQEASVLIHENTGIHVVCLTYEGQYLSECTDVEVLIIVDKVFPPYADDDPLIEEEHKRFVDDDDFLDAVGLRIDSPPVVDLAGMKPIEVVKPTPIPELFCQHRVSAAEAMMESPVDTTPYVIANCRKELLHKVLTEYLDDDKFFDTQIRNTSIGEKIISVRLKPNSIWINK